MFVSPKLEQQLKRYEFKPPIVNEQCLLYEFKCNLCDAGYVGYTRGHLHERVEGHTRKSFSIYKHYNLQHNSEMPNASLSNFTPSRSGKFDWLVKEMLLFNHFHHNRETGCGGGRTTERGSKLSAPFYPPNHDIAQKTDHNTGNYMPYSLRQVCGFFYVPQDYEH